MSQSSHRLAIGIAILVAGFFCWPKITQAAILKIEPTAGTLTVGQHVVISVEIDTQGQAINAAAGTITWDADRLAFDGVAKTGSIFPYWSTEPAEQGSGKVYFSGGLPDPGYTGTNGTILHLDVVARVAGSVTLSVTDGKVLANDGSATSLPVTAEDATFTIAADPPSDSPVLPSPPISSANFPDQLSWYNDPVAVLAWTKPPGSIGFSYSISRDLTTIPTDTVVTTNVTTFVSLPSDGLWYFHLRAKYPTGWSVTSHYVLRLDRTPPDVFTATVVQDRGATDPTPVVTFATTDALSGINDYRYALDGGPASITASPTDVSGLSAGKHTVVVTAYDRAGNARQSSADFVVAGYAAPTIISIPSTVVLLDPLVIRGLANSGDVITVYANSQVLGQVVAGAGGAANATGVTLRVPWSLTSDKLFRPGVFVVTATATSSDGQVSVPTDRYAVHVSGQTLIFHGHPIATLSVVTPASVLLLIIGLAVVAIMVRLSLAVRAMHRRTGLAEFELETLRRTSRRQPITSAELDTALGQIERDLAPGPKRRAKKSGR